MRAFGVGVLLALFLAACGGGEPAAEATWETHTTAEEGSSGGEAADETERPR